MTGRSEVNFGPESLSLTLASALPVRAVSVALREVPLDEALNEYGLLVPAGEVAELLELARHPSVQPRRAANAVRDRVALYAAMRVLFPGAPVGLSGELALRYTELGGPKVVLEGDLAAWAESEGVAAEDLHISYTHDGGVHVCLLAYADGLRGAGVDLVHLPRMRMPGKDRDYLGRFARQFMGAEELAAWDEAGRAEEIEALRVRTAAHFSLMEAASKALGTGLKIGGGMGRPLSLPKRSISVVGLEPVRFALSADAVARMEELGASELCGYWVVDDVFLVSAAILRA